MLKPGSKEVTTKVNRAYCDEIMKQLEASGVSHPSWMLAGKGILVTFVRSGKSRLFPLADSEDRDARQFVRDALTKAA